MEILLLEAEKEFESFIKTPGEYKNKVKTLSANFGLEKPMHLHETELARYWSGNLSSEKEKIVLIELNPSYNKETIALENKFRKYNWNQYREFQNNVFLFYKNNSNWAFRYYQSIAAGLTNKTFKNRSHLDFLHENLLRIDLLPYTSVDFNKHKLSENAETYLFQRFKDKLLPSLKSNGNIKKILLQNKRLTELLLKKNFITADHMVYVRMNKGSKHDFIYKKKYKDLDLYIFSRSIPFGGFGKSEVYSNIF